MVHSYGFNNIKHICVFYFRNISTVTLRASEAAAQCVVISPICGFVCVFVGVFDCESVTTITR